MTLSALKIPTGGISQRNRAYVETLHRVTGAVFDVEAAARALEKDPSETSRLLGYLARRGWLARVRRGVYVAVPLDSRRSGEWIEDAWVVADAVFSPCYVGGWTACQHWDLTEQIFRSVLVVSARKVHQREIVMQGIPFRVTVRPRSKMFGTVPVWRGQSRVLLSDPSRTIIDILDDPRLGGGIRNTADVLEAYLDSEHRNEQLLTEYGDRLGNRTVFKRLGYLLEHAQVEAPDLIRACLDRRSAGLGLLDPSVNALGRILRRWGLRIDAELSPEGRYVISRADIVERVGEWSLTEEVVEKDYVLGWLLWGIGSDPVLGQRWVFKGGTCLKKCYIETYRFSEDLDFTVLPGAPYRAEDVEPHLQRTLTRVRDASGIDFLARPPALRLRPDGMSTEGRVYYVGPRQTPHPARLSSTSRPMRRLFGRRSFAKLHTRIPILFLRLEACGATRSRRSSQRSCARWVSGVARGTSMTS